jgi:hypothetical protein
MSGLVNLKSRFSPVPVYFSRMDEFSLKFRRWMDGHQMKAADVADALFVTEQSVRNWRSAGIPLRRQPQVADWMARIRSDEANSVTNSAPVRSDTIQSPTRAGESRGSTADGILSFCNSVTGEKGKRRAVEKFSVSQGRQETRRKRNPVRHLGDSYGLLLQTVLGFPARFAGCRDTRSSDTTTRRLAFFPRSCRHCPPSKESIPNRPLGSG